MGLEVNLRRPGPRGRLGTLMDELRQSRKRTVDVSSNQERRSE